MDQRLAGIYLVMKELGGFSLESFDDRLFLQKAIYLLQILGVDLRFRFSWYLRGPYSNALTQCAFEIDGSDKLKTDFDNLKLRPEVLQKVGTLRNWIEQKPNDLREPHWFELLSSIHYLKHISRPDTSLKPENASSHLESAGKHGFEQRHILAAWGTLDRTGLIDHKKLDRPSTL